MRILLDESVPRQLKHLLPGHEVLTAVERGWASVANGELLLRASTEFEILVTADQGVPSQQKLSNFNIAVIVLVAKTNTMVEYKLLAEKLRLAVETARPGEASWVAA